MRSVKSTKSGKWSTLGTFKILQVLAAFFMPCLILAGVAYGGDAWKDVRGVPFETQSKEIQMPAKWLKQPIKYEKWAEQADFAIVVDQHLYPAILPFITSYARKNNLYIPVREGTCGIAAGMITRKEVDMAGFCCPPGLTDRLPGLHFHTLGIGAVALLVNAENPIENITMNEAREIFRGNIHRWSELKTYGGKPGPDIPIQVIGRLHCKNRPGHWTLLLKDETLFSPRMFEVGEIPDMLSHVANYKGAIGYEVPWNLIHYQRKGKVKALKIDGLSPDVPDNVISGKYSLYRTYNVTTWGDSTNKNPNSRKILDHLLGSMDSVDPVYGIIPVSRLKKAGWKFDGTELVGEPNAKTGH
ncbi:MAG: hypothetical protein HQK89_04480 [Nitrospirae bacterium]|nr:hypothetical protein [Nitrospirota bacterium]